MATEILLFGRVGTEIDAKRLADQLAESSGEVTLRLNSCGGNLFEGLAINTALQRHPGGVTIEIEGACLSSALVIAAGGRRVRVTQGSLLMLHLPYNTNGGTAAELESSIAMLKRGADSMIDIFHQRTRLPKARLREMAKTETWMNAAEAVQLRFADEVIQATETIAASAVDLAAHWNAAVSRSRTELQSRRRLRVTPLQARNEAGRRYPQLRAAFVNDFNKQHRKATR